MNAKTRPLSLALAVLALACQSTSGQTTGGTAAAASPAKPRLILFVSVDQMKAEYLQRFAPLYKAGFKRLLDQGAVFANAYYRHANTETGPGHSVLLSGRHADTSGIVSNEWYDERIAGELNVVGDPVQTTVGGKGFAASPANFLATTVGDALKKANPASRVLGVSMKDRSAILMAGRRADGAFWYEGSTGQFISSTYYFRDGKAPAWLDQWNAARKIDAYAGKSWERLLGDLAIYEKYAGPDAVEGESDRKAILFPHPVVGEAGSAKLGDSVRATPFIDELTLDIALRVVDEYQLGKDDVTDLLAVGFSANDVVGHMYGPDSQEMLDQQLRLDQTLGRLFDAIDERVGKGNWVFGLSADHGAMPLVEVLQKQGLPAKRIRDEDVFGPVQAAVARAFPGKADLLNPYDASPPNGYLNLAAIQAAGLKRADVEAVVRKALMATGLVDRVYMHSDFIGDPPADDPEFPLFRAAFFAPRSPHYIVRLKKWLYLSDRPGGTGHGTVQEYDRHVPVAFMGPWIKHGAFTASAGPEDIAPTLSKILGFDYRLEKGQRILEEALAR